MSKITLQLDSVNAYKNNMFNAMASVYKERGLQGFNVGYLGKDFFSRMNMFIYISRILKFSCYMHRSSVLLAIVKICVYVCMCGMVGVQYRQAAWSAGYFASLPFFEAKVWWHMLSHTH